MDPGNEHIQLRGESSPVPADDSASPLLTEEGPEPARVARRSHRGRRLVREVVETGLLAVLVFLCVRGSLGNYKVEGHSMDPTLADGQHLIVNKLTYARVDVERLRQVTPFWGDAGADERELFSGPQRGDIVILHDPRDHAGKELVKRVIGLPGEVLEISAGRVYINGRLLDEPYIHQKWSGEKPRVLIPEGDYFVLGDNRDGSADSRYFGLVPRDLIVGKVALRTWPAGDAGADFGGAPALDAAVTRP